MAQVRLSMRAIKEILRLHHLNLSNRQIAGSLGVSRTSVATYLALAKAAGFSWPLPEELSDSEIYEKLNPAAAEAKTAFPLPDFEAIHLELKKKGVTLRLLWEEYRQQYPQGYSYSQFCQYHRRWAKQLSPTMRQIHVPGEKGFIDYSGDKIEIVDPKTGEVREAELFVFTLGASSYTFAEASWSQDVESWINSHVRAFEFFGGVPRLLIPDNLKSAVTKACRYEPQIQRSYEDMAVHYGTAVLPTRVRKPKDKAKVESAVQVVQRWILAALRNRTFYSLAEANSAIRAELEKLNDKPMQKLDKSRKELFESLEKDQLLPLPQNPYQFATFHKATLNLDYHIELLKHYYSAPFQLIHQALEVKYTQSLVEIFHNGKRVATHRRSYQKYHHTTCEDHMPKAHQKYAAASPARLIEKGRAKGAAIGELLEAIIQSKAHPQQGMRTGMGILRLEKDFGKERLNQACQKALNFKIYSVQGVKNILKNHLEKLAKEESASAPKQTPHQNLRGADYYRLKETKQDAQTQALPLNQSTPNSKENPTHVHTRRDHS